MLHSRNSSKNCHSIWAFTGKGISTGQVHHFLAAHVQEGNKNCCHCPVVPGAFHKHSSKDSWVRMYCLEQLSLGGLACVVLHENTTAAANGLSITKMQAPVLDLVNSSGDLCHGKEAVPSWNLCLIYISRAHSTSLFAGTLKLVAYNCILLRHTPTPKTPSKAR